MIKSAERLRELSCLDHYHEVLHDFKKDSLDISAISETSMIISQYLSENFYASESILDIYIKPWEFQVLQRPIHFKKILV